MNTLYYKIKSSQVSIISQSDALVLEKQGVFYTRGTEIEEEKIFNDDEIKTELTKVEVYIFDLDKDSIIPELVFLDSHKGSSKNSFNIFGAPLVIVIIFVCTYLYFNFISDDSGSQDNSSIITSISPETIVENIPSNVPEIDFTGITIEKEPQDVLEPNIIDNSNELQKLNLVNKEKTYKIQDLQVENKRIISLYNTSRSDMEEAKAIAKNLLKESLNKTEEIENLKNSLLSQNQLHLYLGKYVFDRCERQSEDATCKQLIFDFYNEKK